MISRPALCSDYFLQVIVHIERLLIVTKSVTNWLGSVSFWVDPIFFTSAIRSFSTGWSDFSTHLFKPRKSFLKDEINVHIAVRKSTSKNLDDEMSC
jgi:hypothetical protein